MSRDSIYKATNDTPVEIPTTCPTCYPVLCEDPDYAYVLTWCSAHVPDLGAQPMRRQSSDT